MSELTLEALAKRVEALEKKLAEREAAASGPKRDWRRVVGMFEGSEFMKQMDSKVLAMREAEREAARRGESEWSFSTPTTSRS